MKTTLENWDKTFETGLWCEEMDRDKRRTTRLCFAFPPVPICLKLSNLRLGVRGTPAARARTRKRSKAGPEPLMDPFHLP